MATSVSSAIAFAGLQDMVNYHDARQIGDLVNDDGTRASLATITDPTTPQGKLIKSHELAASGMIEAAALQGERYVPADLGSAGQRTGTGSISQTATVTVTGTSTLFTTELAVGDTIESGTAGVPGAIAGRVVTITTATSLTLDTIATGATLAYLVTPKAMLSGVGRQTLVKLTVELAFWSMWSRRHPDKQMTPSALWAFDMLDKLQQGSRIFGFAEVQDAGLPTDDFLNFADLNKRGEISDQAGRYFGRRSKVRRIGGAWYGGDSNSDDCG